MKQNSQGKATCQLHRAPTSSSVILLLLSVLATLVSSTLASLPDTQQQQQQHQQTKQEVSTVEQQLAQLASHLSANFPPTALSLVDIRRQLVGPSLPTRPNNESLLFRQLDEYLLQGDYMKLFSAGFERLMEMAGDPMASNFMEEPCLGGADHCNESKRRVKRATGLEDGLNQTEPQQTAESVVNSAALGSPLPRPPTKQPSSHKGSATAPNAAGKRRHRPSSDLQQSINEQADKSAIGEQTESEQTTETSPRDVAAVQSETQAGDASLQPEAGGLPDGDASFGFSEFSDAGFRRRIPEHSAKLSIVQVPAPEQSSMRVSSAEPAGAKTTSGDAGGAQSLDNNLDNLDVTSLPDLSSILGQLQANADLENLEYLSKQFNNGSQASSKQVWEPQLSPVDGLDSGNLRGSLHAPYVALDTGRGGSQAAGEFSVRQGALQEENGAATRYSSQLGPIYGSSTSTGARQAANLRLPAPLGSGGGGQRSRNQRGSGSAAKKDNQPSTQWTKINNNENQHTRRPAPEGPIYPDSIQQQLYGLTGVRGGSTRAARGPQPASSYVGGQQQQQGASNHHPRIIPMNYVGEQAALVQGGEEFPAPSSQAHGSPGQPSQVLGLLQLAAPIPHHHNHQHQHQHQQQRLRRTARRASPLLLAASSPLESALRGHHGAVSTVAGAHPADYLHLYPAWPAAAARYSSGKGGQRSYQHRIGHGEETAATIATTSTTDPMWTDTHQHDDDYQQSPQTIQITAVPNGLGLVGNGLAGLNGWPNAFGAGFNGFNGLNGWNGLAGGPWNGRQVLLVNKQPGTVGSGLEWRSWLIPVAIILALPLVLGALFVPVFLKSVMFLIQILQMLGVLMPPSQLASHLLSGGSSHSQQSG